MENITLDIKRPIVFFDLETTGIDIIHDRIVEISLLKLKQNLDTEQYTIKVNPTIPIPADASAIHGIKNEDVQDAPLFKDICPKIERMIANCDLSGFNSDKFDLPLLCEEFLRAGSEIDLKKHKILDVMNIFHIMEPRNLAAAYRFYCDKEMENAHSAEYDTKITYEVFLHQLKKYSHKKMKVRGKEIDFNNIESLFAISESNNFIDFSGRMIYKNGVEVFNFGKYKGISVTDIFEKDPSYYKWMMDKDFSLHTKKMLEQIYNKWKCEKIKEGIEQNR